MTDIVERLCEGIDPLDIPDGERLMDEAAAEIERLREALRVGADTLHRMEQVLAAGLDQMAKAAQILPPD